MSCKVLITGASGFTGRHLCAYLKQLPVPPYVCATDLIPCFTSCCDSYFQVQLSDEKAVRSLIASVLPDIIIHLAGTFGAATETELYHSNVISTSIILQISAEVVPTATVLIMGSAAEYGQCETVQLPIMETTPCRPISLYGLTKLLATQIADYYCRVKQLRVMVARPFQLIGHGVSTRLAPGAFAEQIKKVKKEKQRVVKVGNLNSSRDFLDVQDAVKALWLLCTNPAPGQIFNLCSGTPIRMDTILKMMIEVSGLDVRIEVDPERLRGAADASVVYGSFDKIYQHCGWKPKKTLHESIVSILHEEENGGK